MSNTCFLDSAATTPTSTQAIEKWLEISRDCYANPSSTHAMGLQAQKAIQEARAFFAQYFDCLSRGVIFTGSGTESDNLAISGIAMARFLESRPSSRKPGRILCSATEHPGVLKTCQSFQDFGFDVQTVGVDGAGQIDQKDLAGKLSPDTILASFHQANNITGAIQDISKIAAQIKSVAPQCVVHSDCIQSFLKVPALKFKNGVDLISLSAHKIGGPKGVGALVVLNSQLLNPLKLRPIIFGGGQEGGFRSGTQSAALIASFHAASRAFLENAPQWLSRCGAHRDFLREQLFSRLKERVRWNSPDDGLPHIINFSVSSDEMDAVLSNLDESGFMVSTGSACSSGKNSADPVLLAMGISETLAGNCLRVSLEPNLQPADIRRFVDVLVASLNEK